MRILHIVEPFSSGITTFIIQLSANITTCHHTVLHGTRATADNIDLVRKRFDQNATFIRWSNARREINPVRDIAALFELYSVLKKNQFDVIHLHSAKAGFLGRLLCWVLGIKPVIYSPNGAPFARKDIGSFKTSLFLFLERLAFKLNGVVITCGKSEYQLYLSKGIRSSYINNGINISSKLSKKNSNDNFIVIGFAGIANLQKAPQLFSDIANSFLHDNRVLFKWIGDGSLADNLKAENIEITGWKKNSNDVLNELDTIDIFLSTSQWEGQPFAVIEAMNLSKCLLLFDCVGNKDLVRNGENGFLFNSLEEANTRIKYLLSNRDIIFDMGRRSYEICLKHHDIKKTSKEYEKAYTDLLNK